MLLGVAAAVLACLGYGVSSVLQAYGARQSAAAAVGTDEGGHATATGAPTLRSTAAAVVTTAFIVGSVLDVAAFAGAGLSARLAPLFLCQTIISANLVVTAVLAVRVLGIRLGVREGCAMALVVVSLLVLGLASGEAGGAGDQWIHGAVLAGAVLVLGIGLVLVRRFGSRAAVPAGLVAGLLFGILAIAIRVLDGVAPFQLGQLLGDPAAVAVAVAGVGGFYLHTVALQLGSVNGATAALVVGETVVPGVIGVIFLGDGARPGMGWIVGVGFACAVAGAVAVAVLGAAAHSTDAAPEPAVAGPEA
ncbi:MAG: rane protein [Marmoricola sp.]|nr:rane protein [Marmoricola sp.]